jgi:hypothetical protein
MTPEQIDRVFGRGRLKMMTGEHVEVYREAVGAGERRRYTKRFLDTGDGDFGQWTEREWRILARLIGHGIRCVPDVVQFDGGAQGGVRLVQTYDAGVTVDQWATLLPVARNGIVHRHAFEDCAHWWALAHYCLAALDEIHRLSLVHLDVKGDNLCIPYGPANFDPDAPELRLYPIFPRLALIDFAFSLVSRETLAAPLPIGWQKDYDYQSPRLLAALEAGRDGDIEPTQELDWRCDFYSLAAMLKRYLPDEDRAPVADGSGGWSSERYADAKALIFRIRDAHDRNFPQWRPHQELLGVTGAKLREPDLAASLDYGWTLARDKTIDDVATPNTPLTRIAPSLATPHRSPIATRVVVPTAVTVVAAPRKRPHDTRHRVAHVLAASLLALGVVAAPSQFGDPTRRVVDDVRAVADALRSRGEATKDDAVVTQSPAPQSAPETAGTTTPEAPPTAAAGSEAAPPSQATAPAKSEAPSASLPAVVSAAPKPAPPASRGHPAPRAQVAQAASARPKYPVPASPSAPPRKASRAKTPPPVHVAKASQAVVPTTPKASTPAPTHAGAMAPSTAMPSVATTPSKLAEPNAVALAAPDTGAPAAEIANAPANVPPAAQEPRTIAGAESPPSVAPPPDERSDPPPAVKPSPPSVASSAPRRNDVRSQLSALWRTLRGRDQPPAPVEERSTRSPSTASALPRVNAPPPVTVAPAAPAPPSNPAPRAMPSPPPVQAATPVRPSEAAGDEYAMLARRMLAESVPRVASQAHADMSRVLWVAANTTHPSSEWAIADAAKASWPSERMAIAPSHIEPTYARRLQDNARHAFASGAGAAVAMSTQLRAFGASPGDADIAGYLAFLHLRANPPQADAARDLALYAIAISGSRRAARSDDWHTFAIASALSGRDADARNAFYVAAALARNADRSCRTALSAYANFGERLRTPAEALIYRIHAQGRSYDSPYCAWPPDWGAVARWP